MNEIIKQTEWGNVFMAAFTAGQAQYIAMTQMGANHTAALVASIMTGISTAIAGAYDSSKNKKKVSGESDIVGIVSAAANTVIPAEAKALAPDLVHNIAKEAERVFRRGVKF